ncbi:MAG TPA: preprotein translocase subunit SecG [Bacteroidales bacterium]|nr:MAG: preprotein translocase subunit SecG [Bacteroidetes bacterium ADurb.Bin217]HOS83707.1 preprotein translocase subunit SecG [Bacteroidales bacterium]HPH15629.1 preprotein translocase subunit SecG [Bacteroidales bacterium]HPM11955.1 preprotein translocase subunit SecG [Bacteroidales bacterium]
MGSVLINIVIIATSVLLVLIVLVQNSKGGGLASNFSSSNQIMGVRKTTDFLEKATWTLAIALVMFCIVATTMLPKQTTIEKRSFFEDNVPENAAQVPQGIQTAEGVQTEE